jgi:hypothetical protein
LVIALHPHTSKHVWGGWSHYTDTCEPVDGDGAQNMVTVQSGFRTRDLLITGPTCLPTALTGHKCIKNINKLNNMKNHENAFKTAASRIYVDAY